MQAEYSRSHSAAVVVTGPSTVMKDVFGRIELLIKQAAKEKALRTPDVELYSVMCIGVVRAVLVAEMLYRPTQLAVAERVEQMVTFFLEGAGA
jgi:hypothetical protein